MEWIWYCCIKRPLIYMLVIAALCCTCIIISLFDSLPSFSDPTQGFETRGTSLGNRLVTWKNLVNATGLTKILTSNPSDLYYSKIRPEFVPSKPQKRTFAKYKKRRKYNKTQNTVRPTNNDKKSLQSSISSSNNDAVVYFCDLPSKIYSHFAVKHLQTKTFTKSLFDLHDLLALCDMQKQITNVPNYKEYCQRDAFNNCCQPWSLANYAAFLSNKTSCFDLTNANAKYVENLLQNCISFYQRSKYCKVNSIELGTCVNIEKCPKYNIVLNILQYIIDVDSVKAERVQQGNTYSMIFIPIVRSTHVLPLYFEWKKLKLSNQFVQIVGMDLGVDNELFDELLVHDAWLIALGGAFIMFFMWLYTSSMYFTIMACAAVTFSIGLSYFIYIYILRMTFFPYMNLLAVVVVVGIGADDAFILIKIWYEITSDTLSAQLTRGEATEPDITGYSRKTIQNIIKSTIRRAAIPMLVTTITTAGAFLASYASYITAIKCFSIFATTAVIANYLLMLTWLPASLLYMEYGQFKLCPSNKLQQCNALNKTLYSLWSFLENYIITAIFNYALTFIFIFGALGIIGIIIVLYKPGLQLPENSHIQIFASQHPFERYHLKLKHKFLFEQATSIEDDFKLPLYFVWGVKTIDNGDYTNPYDYGTLQFDNDFKAYTKATQVWILKFCENLKKQSFYETSFGLYLPNCFMQNFITLMNRACWNNMDNKDYTPCCNVSKFPYEKDVFDVCLPHIISSLYNTPRKYFIPSVAGPKFLMPVNSLKHSNDFSAKYTQENFLSHNVSPLVKAVVIEIETNVSYTAKYSTVEKFVQIVDKWFNNELQNAPAELQNGWFISELKLFDLQDSLYKGTSIAITISMCISMVVLFLFTFNILIAFYAVITILFAMFVTIAILVLFGWQLNILESIAVTAAIGLIVDFSLHYGMHYRLVEGSDRLESTSLVLKRLMSPTAMAAFTTATPGVLVLLSNVLPYIQIGTFLLVMMSTSWLYATFFLMSLLKLFGPQNNRKHFSHRSINNNINLIEDNQFCNTNNFVQRNSNHFEIHEMQSIIPPNKNSVKFVKNSSR